jgi:hypothetical protein
MGVPPLRGVERADVVAAHETDLVVDDQQLAVGQPGRLQRAQQQTRAQDGEAEDVHLRVEAVEAAGHHEVAEAVVHHVHLDTACGGVVDGVQELAADLVVLPDEGLQLHPVLRAPDRGEHVPEEVLPVRVDRGAGLGDRVLERARAREPGAPRAAPALDRVGGHQGGHHHRLHGEQAQDGADGEGAEHAGARGARGRHSQSVPAGGVTRRARQERRATTRLISTTAPSGRLVTPAAARDGRPSSRTRPAAPAGLGVGGSPRT